MIYAVSPLSFICCKDLPILVATLAHNPPVYVYSAIFQEYAVNKTETSSSRLSLGSPAHPPIITGAADGRIRVWKGSSLVGDLIVGEGGEGGGGMRRSAQARNNRRGSIREGDIDTEYRVDSNDIPHYGGMVQALAIDVRSKYLFSGDSRGEILIWRPNNSGWYQLLRKFRKGRMMFDLKCILRTYMSHELYDQHLEFILYFVLSLF
jgi:hypothetical protein